MPSFSEIGDLRFIATYLVLVPNKVYGKPGNRPHFCPLKTVKMSQSWTTNNFSEYKLQISHSPDSELIISLVLQKRAVCLIEIISSGGLIKREFFSTWQDSWKWRWRCGLPMATSLDNWDIIDGQVTHIRWSCYSFKRDLKKNGTDIFTGNSLPK